MNSEMEAILKKVAAGEMSVGGRVRALENKSEENLGFARIDLDRHHRKGIPEVIYSAGKTPDQIVQIIDVFKKSRQNCSLHARDARDVRRGSSRSPRARSIMKRRE